MIRVPPFRLPGGATGAIAQQITGARCVASYHPFMVLRRHLIAVAVLLAGCAQSRFSVVEPTEFARTVEMNHSFMQRPPIDYQIFVENNRLRMYLNNHADTPIKIVGGDSYVIDAHNQSLALFDKVIPPNTFIAITMPPRRPRGGGGVGFGVGVGGGSDGTFGGVGIGTGYHDDYDAVDDPPYYDWPGGDLRVHLLLEQDGKRTEHEFLFRREQK